MNALTIWLVAAMLRFAPIDTRPQFPGFEESADETRDRYESIARDIATAAEGSKSRAAMLLAIALHESGLAADTDVGPCYQKGVHAKRCDSGRSATIWQIRGGVRWEGRRLTYRELFEDRLRAAVIADWAAQRSLRNCAHLAPEDRLSGYGAGHCVAGIKTVREVWAQYRTLRAWTPAP